jgi:hypothetical protein
MRRFIKEGTDTNVDSPFKLVNECERVGHASNNFHSALASKMTIHGRVIIRERLIGVAKKEGLINKERYSFNWRDFINGY